MGGVRYWFIPRFDSTTVRSWIQFVKTPLASQRQYISNHNALRVSYVIYFQPQRLTSVSRNTVPTSSSHEAFTVPVTHRETFITGIARVHDVYKGALTTTILYKVPDEIKRSRGGRWSWTFKLSPKEIMRREVELGCESWTSFASSCSSTAVQRTLSL